MNSRALDLEKQYAEIGTIHDLSSVFEAIAGIQVAQIKDKVVSSTTFFNELWQNYCQLRIDQKEAIGHQPKARPGSVALVAVTSDGGLIGDIDERIIQALLADTRSEAADIFVIGLHGINLLHLADRKATQAFALPDTDHNDLPVSGMADAIGHYETATMYYQQYMSLGQQVVAHIDLFTAVAVLGREQAKTDESIISSRDYLFEPSQRDIVDYMESAMLEIALGQVILESKLAQDASRFTAMSAARHKAAGRRRDLHRALRQVKRAAEDEQAKATVSTLQLLAGNRVF